MLIFFLFCWFITSHGHLLPSQPRQVPLILPAAAVEPWHPIQSTSPCKPAFVLDNWVRRKGNSIPLMASVWALMKISSSLTPTIIAFRFICRMLLIDSCLTFQLCRYSTKTGCLNMTSAILAKKKANFGIRVKLPSFARPEKS